MEMKLPQLSIHIYMKVASIFTTIIAFSQNKSQILCSLQ